MRADVAGVGLDEAGVAGERRAVVVGLREVGVEALGEALRADADRGDRRAPARGSRSRARSQNSAAQRRDQHAERDQLDLLGLDLLAEVLGRAPDHQAADEDREQDVEQDRVQAGADAAEDHLAGRQVRERDRAAEPGVGLDRAVDRAARGDGRDDVEQRRAGDPEALLLALEVAAGRCLRATRVRGRRRAARASRAPRRRRRRRRRRRTSRTSSRRSRAPGGASRPSSRT